MECSDSGNHDDVVWQQQVVDDQKNSSEQGAKTDRSSRGDPRRHERQFNQDVFSRRWDACSKGQGWEPPSSFVLH
jgi:hypothetical protein